MACFFPTWEKDPDAVKDYVLDWSEWLNTSDTVASVVHTVPVGITLDSEGATTTQTTAILSGGTLGTTYECKAHIVTAAGLEEDQTFKIKMVEN